MPDKPSRLIRCPTCGLTVGAPVDAPLPDEGRPTCAMGHEPIAMTVIDVGAPNHG